MDELSQMPQVPETVPIMVAFGNPLLDISVVLQSDKSILDNYNLQLNSEIEISEKNLRSILADLAKNSFNTQYGAGGAAQNTARIMQWLLKRPHSVAYVGAIGNDDSGKKLAEIVNSAGVRTSYVIHEGKSTGTCVAFVNGPNRSLCAHLGAAVTFSLNDLENNQGVYDLLIKTDLVYVEGFFITGRQDVVNKIMEFCYANDKIFVFNINGAYLFQSFAEDVKKFAIECDLLFGNAIEFEALGEYLDIADKSIKSVILYLNDIYQSKKTKQKHKIVAVTDGPNQILCVCGNKNLIVYNVPEIPSTEIVDTTGAGDAFVAGFLAAYVSKMDIGMCLAWGCWTARQIIARVGCQVPDIPPDQIYTIHL